MSGLAASDFELRDDGVVQQITDISHQVLPVDVTFIADLSGSVRGPLLGELARAIDAVSAHLGPADRATLVTFNHRIHEVGPLPDPAHSIAPIIGTSAGQTSMLDALVASLITASNPERRRMAILFTDGMDTTSFEDGTTVLEVARRTEAAVFTVALMPDRADPRQRPPDDALFEALASATGGAVTVLEHGSDLGGSFLKAFDDFRSSYVLRYTYASTPKPGWHALEVQVKQRGRFDVRARQGYVR